MTTDRRFERRSLTGERFGLLTVGELVRIDASGHGYWECVCDCGTVTVVRDNGLTGSRNGGHPNTFSCGCWRANPENRRAARLTLAPAKRKQIARQGQAALQGKAKAKAKKR